MTSDRKWRAAITPRDRAVVRPTVIPPEYATQDYVQTAANAIQAALGDLESSLGDLSEKDQVEIADMATTDPNADLASNGDGVIYAATQSNTDDESPPSNADFFFRLSTGERRKIRFSELCAAIAAELGI